MPSSSTTRGIVLSVAGALFSAAFLVPYQQASLLGGPQLAAFLLLATAAAWNGAAAVIELRGRRPRIDGIALVTALLLGLLSVAGNLCSARALATIDPATTSVLNRTQIVFVALGGALFLGEPLRRSLAGGTVIALGGFIIMRMPGTGADVSLAGALWAIGAAACFAAMVLITRKVIHRIQPVTVNTLRLVLAVAILAAAPGTAASVARAGPRMWLMCALAGFFGPFLSRLFIMWGLRHVTAALQVLLALLSPLFAFILAFALVGTVPSRLELVGGSIMLAGIAVPVVDAYRSSRRSARARRDPRLAG